MDYKSDKINSDQNSQLSFRIFSGYGTSIATLGKEGKEKIKQNLINEEEKRDLLCRFGGGIYSTDSDDYLYLYYTILYFIQIKRKL